MNDEEKQARKFLTDHGLTLTMTRKGDRCPPWAPKDCEHKHGDRYRMTLRRETGEGVLFDFWGREADKEAGKDPAEWDVLACLRTDAATSTDPDEVAEEYGGMKPSRAAAIARLARRLQTFFSEEELDALWEFD